MKGGTHGGEHIQKNKQARLDFFLIADNLQNSINDIQINAGYRSDHSPVILEMKLNKFKKGKGLWTFNNSLLGDKDYIELIKKKIQQIKTQYAVPMYKKKK